MSLLMKLQGYLRSLRQYLATPKGASSNCFWGSES